MKTMTAAVKLFLKSECTLFIKIRFSHVKQDAIANGNDEGKAVDKLICMQHQVARVQLVDDPSRVYRILMSSCMYKASTASPLLLHSLFIKKKKDFSISAVFRYSVIYNIVNLTISNRHKLWNKCYRKPQIIFVLKS